MTETDLLDQVASILQRPDRGSLEPFWAVRAAPAIAAATAEITGALLARGYTTSQIDAWDRRDEYQRSISLFFSLLDGIALAGRSSDEVKLYDRRKELLTCAVTVGGQLVTPGLAASGGGSAVGGRTSDVTHSLPYGLDTQF